MQVPCDLASLRLSRRFVAKDEAADGEFPCDGAAKPGGRMRVVIALDPNPVGSRDLTGECDFVLFVEPGCGLAVMKGIAQRHHASRSVSTHQCLDTIERRARIVRREQRAAFCEGGALLEVDVRHDQRPFGRPPGGTCAIEQEGLAVDLNEHLFSRHASLP